VEDTGGAAAIEYALIASLISVVILAGVTGIGTQVVGMFKSVGSGLP
jgi:Flp pilus assembly pilin Flp